MVLHRCVARAAHARETSLTLRSDGNGACS
jgi:hypothetical protein